jgi:hypothetical protein
MLEYLLATMLEPSMREGLNTALWIHKRTPIQMLFGGRLEIPRFVNPECFIEGFHLGIQALREKTFLN